MPLMTPGTFVALDFETADYQADSACAIGLVRVTDGRIVRRERHLIRPPRRKMLFTSVHGITWQQVADQPCFGDLWPSFEQLFDDVDFIAAHNASFDRRVLMACCESYKIKPPTPRFVCTVKLARSTWDIYPTKLPNVCEHLGIELQHHEALSDAEACAKIVISAISAGARI